MQTLNGILVELIKAAWLSFAIEAALQCSNKWAKEAKVCSS